MKASQRCIGGLFHVLLVFMLTSRSAFGCADANAHNRVSAMVVADTAAMHRVIKELRPLAASYPDSVIRVLEVSWSRISLNARRLVGLEYFLSRAEARFYSANMAACVLECDSAMRYRRVGHAEDDAAINFWKGKAFIEFGDYAIASRSLEASLLVYSDLDDSMRMAECNNELGWIHYVQEQYALAERRWRTMLTLSRAAKDLRLEAVALRRVGLACLYLYDPDAIGQAYYDSALATSRRLGDLRELAGIHSNIGRHMDSALYYARKHGDETWLHRIMHTAGVLSMRKGDLETGLNYCDEVLRFAERSGNRMLERDAAQCLCEYYRLTGQWQEAFQAQEQWRAVNDQLISSRSRDEIAMRAIENTRLREDSLADAAELLKLESARAVERVRADRNRIAALSIASGGALLLSGVVVFYLLDRKRRRERFERDAARLQMQVLRTQMNPHFIFNALNSINNYVQENERDLASGFLGKFARLMRLVLENSRHEEVPLAQDLEALRLYMDLEQARLNHRFQYTVEVDPSIDQENTMVPPLVLQPFVENAIWHGLSRKADTGHLVLAVKQDGGSLLMTIEDDGVGRNPMDLPLPEDAPPKSSLGTNITRERLEMLATRAGGEAGFRYAEVSEGTRVEVRMPYHTA